MLGLPTRKSRFNVPSQTHWPACLPMLTLYPNPATDTKPHLLHRLTTNSAAPWSLYLELQREPPCHSLAGPRRQATIKYRQLPWIPALTVLKVALSLVCPSPSVAARDWRLIRTIDTQNSACHVVPAHFDTEHTSPSHTATIEVKKSRIDLLDLPGEIRNMIYDF